MTSSTIRIRSELKQLILKPEPFFKVFADPDRPILTPFDKGLFHGVIFLPRDYPFSAPDIQFFTNNGRFEVKKNICTNFTSYHQESWTATWGIRQVIIGLRSMFDEETPGAIGSIYLGDEQRFLLTQQSISYHCDICGCDHSNLQLNDEQVHTNTEISKIEVPQNQNQQIVENVNSISNIDAPQNEDSIQIIQGQSLNETTQNQSQQFQQLLYNYVYFRK